MPQVKGKSCINGIKKSWSFSKNRLYQITQIISREFRLDQKKTELTRVTPMDGTLICCLAIIT
jgi:hypothetical protein